MTDKLPADAPSVKSLPDPIRFYPIIGEALDHAAHLLRDVRAVCLDSARLDPASEERCALCAIDAVRYLHTRGDCLCLMCMWELAEGNYFYALCLRWEVLRQTGIPAIKTPHRGGVLPE